MNLKISNLISSLYEDNQSHFDFMENMNGGDCNCVLHRRMSFYSIFKRGA